MKTYSEQLCRLWHRNFQQLIHPTWNWDLWRQKFHSDEITQHHQTTMLGIYYNYDMYTWQWYFPCIFLASF